ncbi:MAG: hypothetical protein R3B51_13975 [Thermodesulfobacteriota bacterium]
MMGIFLLIAAYACDGDKTTGEVIDDTVITSTVKTKLRPIPVSAVLTSMSTPTRE